METAVLPEAREATRAEQKAGTLARLQCGLALAPILAMALSIMALDSVAHSGRLERWLTNQLREFSRQTGTEYVDAGYYIDHEDKLLTEQLPAQSYPDGGVYIFGTCNARVDFPPGGPIYDFATANTSHDDTYQLLRYLIDQRGLLRAGAGKCHVVFALSYHASRKDPTGFFPNLWGRHGLYTYSPARGIADAPISPLRRFIGQERTRIAGFMACLGEYAVQEMHHLSYSKGEPPKKHYPAYYKEADYRYMGSNWETGMREEVQWLGQAVGELQQRGVSVTVALLPLGTWEDDLPFKREY